MLVMNKDRIDFFTILEKQNLTTHYQPIVSAKSGAVFGYEALTRGPKNSSFYNPLDLFAFAEEENLLFPLEKLARELAIAKSKPYRKDNEKLFINIHPNVMNDPDFTPGHTKYLLEVFQLNPKDIILEITERSAIEDFKEFRRILKHYRLQGFQIAIDDAGAGYSSLQSISELSPEFIKIDRSLIQHIDKNETKKHLVDALIQFSKKMNCSIIGEGVETKGELRQVTQMGIDYTQGYFLAKPAYPFPTISEKSLEIIQEQDRKVLETKQVKEIMDPQVRTFEKNPFTVKFDTSLLTALRLMLLRSDERAFDDIAVTEDGRIIGSVTVEKIIDCLLAQKGSPL